MLQFRTKNNDTCDRKANGTMHFKGILSSRRYSLGMMSDLSEFLLFTHHIKFQYALYKYNGDIPVWR